MRSYFSCRLHITLNILSAICISFNAASIDLQQGIKREFRDETGPPAGASPSSVAAVSFLLASTNEPRLNSSDPVDVRLIDILQRNSPDMKPSRDNKEFSDITEDVSQRAWSLLHERTRLVVNQQIRLAEPSLKEVLISSKVSSDCFGSVEQVLEGARRMESWAIKIVAAWGNFPPNALFEGTYSEVGSYQSCVDIPSNQFIDHAHYCQLNFRPVMKSRTKYGLLIDKQPKGLLDLFELSNGSATNLPVISNRSKDAFSDLLDQAQYFHFVYFKMGSCWPIKCSPFDIRRVAKVVARRNVFMTGPVKCFSKFTEDYEQPGSVETFKSGNGSEPVRKRLAISTWDLNEGIFISKPHFSNAQKAALVVVGILIVFIGLMTLMDILVNRLPRLFVELRYSLVAPTINVPDSSARVGTAMVISQSDRDEVENTLTKALNFELADRPSRNNIPSTINRQKSYLPVATDNLVSLQASFASVPPPVVQNTNHRMRSKNPIQGSNKSVFLTSIEYCSICTNCIEFFTISDAQLRNIMCLDGIRCLTMAWIIMAHTMMYNDWSAFARTREVEKAITSVFGQPLFNGSYLVDSFFLMSGLLSAYTAFKHSKGLASKFNSVTYITNRWLRLTPQVFLVSMLLIILPALSDGPHWFPITYEYSENCQNNWWINMLHLQAFYKTEKMCNFVTWWISIDFFYHFIALAIIWVILVVGHRGGFIATAAIVAGHVAWQALQHYQLGLPPNVFATMPQTGPMWTQMIMSFYWRPYSHSAPFFFGFYLGYLMALKRKLVSRWFNRRRAIVGWSLAAVWFFGSSFSSYWWVTGKVGYSRLVATSYHIVCPILWSASLCWVIAACHYGYGGLVNSLLTNRTFIILGRASYLIYLSHFQIMFLFFGNQHVLLEPSLMIMFYVILGNIVLSTFYGSLLCIVFEMPWLKAQRKLIQQLKW